MRGHSSLLFLNRCWTTYPAISSGMVAVGDCSWNGYSSLILSYILLIGILWCGCGFIPGVCSWSSQRNSNIASMSGSFFRGVLGILGVSEEMWECVAWFYFSCASNTSTSSYSGFASVLSSSARSITAVSSVYASARIGMPLLGVYDDVEVWGRGHVGGLRGVGRVVLVTLVILSREFWCGSAVDSLIF